MRFLFGVAVGIVIGRPSLNVLGRVLNPRILDKLDEINNNLNQRIADQRVRSAEGSYR